MYTTPVMLEFILHQSLLLFPYSHFSVLVDFKDRLERDLHLQNFYIVNETKMNVYKLTRTAFVKMYG